MLLTYLSGTCLSFFSSPILCSNVWSPCLLASSVEVVGIEAFFITGAEGFGWVADGLNPVGAWVTSGLKGDVVCFHSYVGPPEPEVGWSFLMDIPCPEEDAGAEGR